MPLVGAAPGRQREGSDTHPLQQTVVALAPNELAFRCHQFIVRFVATVSNGKCSNQSGRDK